ncbi:arsenical pump-driving ATPase [bacterium]|nr:arsenical pump-driving ATPase [bacterium]
MHDLDWWRPLTRRYLFFTGKGGVGKTSLACATSLALCDEGRRVLLVSTDPASNLDEVFGLSLASRPQALPDVPGLWACNLDPMEAAAAYREKVVGPYRGVLPPAVIRNMEEQFSGACTTELATFAEFVALMADDQVARDYDHIVFDTAPTGHTLRLLSLPGAWSGYLNTTTAESSCLGPLAGLQEQRERYALALQRLGDASQTAVVLVARPDKSSLNEARRTRQELTEMGVANIQLLINGVLGSHSQDPTAQAMRALQQDQLIGVEGQQVALLPVNLVGLKALRALNRPPEQVERASTLPSIPSEFGSLDQLAEELRANGKGVVMTMGKGGVGKTTVALQLARKLSESGCRVRLTTTDPAGDLTEGDHGLLRIDRIEPQREIKRYTDEVLARAAAKLDEQGLALLKEDLRSPCTEEIAVFRAFAEAVHQGEHEFVIIDTAPTGHTILLMDASEAYSREVRRNQQDSPESVTQLLPRLRDPQFTRVVLVTLAEPTPVHEAASLQADLLRAQISPFAWVVNRSLLASGTQDPVLASRAIHEAACLAEVLKLGDKAYLEPLRLAQAVHA